MQKTLKKYWPVFVLPTLIAFAIAFILPFVIGLYLSFCDFTTITNATFIGFENYKTAFAAGQNFLYSFSFTALFTVISIVTVNVIAFVLAYFLTKKLKGTNFFRTVFFMPNLIGGLILGFIWQFMFNSVFTGIGQKLGSSILSTSMLQEPSTAVLAMLIVSTWQYAGYIMVIYVSALENVPNDLIEAAHIDGANGIQTFKHITIPMVRQGITICLFLTLANSFKMFDLNFSLSPAKATEMMALNIYKEAFVVNNLGIGQAKAVIFFILVTTISLTQVYFNKKKEVEA